MQADVRRKLAMTVRALDFERAHLPTDPSQTGVDDRLAERIARAETLAIQEEHGRLDEQGAVTRRLQLRSRIHYQMLRHLVRTANAAVKDAPALAGQFILPRTGAPHRYFLTAAKAMLDRAVEFKEVLLAHGLGATLIDELTKALAEFDTTTGSVHSGRVSHVGARAELKEVVDDCVQLVGLLDGLNLTRYQDDAQLLAAWESARTVVGSGRVNGNGNGAAPVDSAPSAAPEASPPVM